MRPYSSGTLGAPAGPECGPTSRLMGLVIWRGRARKCLEFRFVVLAPAQSRALIDSPLPARAPGSSRRADQRVIYVPSGAVSWPVKVPVTHTRARDIGAVGQSGCRLRSTAAATGHGRTFNRNSSRVPSLSSRPFVRGLIGHLAGPATSFEQRNWCKIGAKAMQASPISWLNSTISTACTMCLGRSPMDAMGRDFLSPRRASSLSLSLSLPAN